MRMDCAQGVDSSYHIWTSVSVIRIIINGISVHSMHKGEVFLSSIVYIEQDY